MCIRDRPIVSFNRTREREKERQTEDKEFSFSLSLSLSLSLARALSLSLSLSLARSLSPPLSPSELLLLFSLSLPVSLLKTLLDGPMGQTKKVFFSFFFLVET